MNMYGKNKVNYIDDSDFNGHLSNSSYAKVSFHTYIQPV